MASQDLHLDLPPIITLPHPDSIVISLYSNAGRDAKVRQFEEQVFKYKINPKTAESRQEYVNQIVEVTSDAPGAEPYYISLYDLMLAWGTTRQQVQQSDLSSEGFQTFHVKTTSDEALKYIIKTSLVDAMFRPNHLSDDDLREALNICYQVSCGYDIQRRLFKQIQRNTWHKFNGTDWYRDGNNVNNVYTFLIWLVYGLEERPAVLWIIEYVLIRHGSGYWYTGPSPMIDAATSEEAFKKGRDEAFKKGRVQGLCYILDTLKKILTDPTAKLPETLLKSVSTVYNAILNTTFNAKTTTNTNTTKPLSFDMCRGLMEKSGEYVVATKAQFKLRTAKMQAEIDASSHSQVDDTLGGLLSHSHYFLDLLEHKLDQVKIELSQAFKLVETNPTSLRPGTISDLVAQSSNLANMINKAVTNSNLIEQLYTQYRGNVPFDLSVINELEHKIKESVKSYSTKYPENPVGIPQPEEFNILRQWSRVSSGQPTSRRSPSPPPPSRPPPSLSPSSQQLSSAPFTKLVAEEITRSTNDYVLGQKAVELTEQDLVDELNILRQLIDMSNESSNTNTPSANLKISIAAQGDKVRIAKQMVNVAKEYDASATKYLHLLQTSETIGSTILYDLRAKMDKLRDQLRLVSSVQQYVYGITSREKSVRLTGK